MPRGSDSGRLPGFDGLRAVACLAVFLANAHHAAGLTVSGRFGPFDVATFAESGVGVVLLIVISGALLSLPFWRAILNDAGPVSIRAYLLARIARLVPAYYACLAVLLVVSGERPSAADVLLHASFANNLTEGTFYSISPQFWTIGMFAQLAVLLPVAFVLLRGRTPRQAFWLVLALSAAAYGAHAMTMVTRDGWLRPPLTSLAERDGFVLSRSTLAHLPQFLLGVAAGYLLVRLQGRASEEGGRYVIRARWFWLAAACLVMLAAMPASAHLELPYGRYLFPSMTLLAVGCIVTAPFSAAATVLEWRPLRALGIVSYGVYVYHVSSLLLMQRLLGPDSGEAGHKLTVATAAFVLTLVVAAGSYAMLEAPVLRWVRTRRQVPSAASTYASGRSPRAPNSPTTTKAIQKQS